MGVGSIVWAGAERGVRYDDQEKARGSRRETDVSPFGDDAVR